MLSIFSNPSLSQSNQVELLRQTVNTILKTQIKSNRSTNSPPTESKQILLKF